MGLAAGELHDHSLVLVVGGPAAGHQQLLALVVGGNDAGLHVLLVLLPARVLQGCVSFPVQDAHLPACNGPSFITSRELDHEWINKARISVAFIGLRTICSPGCTSAACSGSGGQASLILEGHIMSGFIKHGFHLLSNKHCNGVVLVGCRFGSLPKPCVLPDAVMSTRTVSQPQTSLPRLDWASAFPQAVKGRPQRLPEKQPL